MTETVAVLTGAASGIGRHFATVLAGRGDYCLALADVDGDRLREAFTAGPQIRLFEFDIRSPSGWRAMIEDTSKAFGRIDYLFNIAGGGRPAFLADFPLEDIDFGIDVNLKGPLYGMKLVGDIMLLQGSGHIINVGSLSGIVPTPGNSLYSAAKAGLRHATLAAAVELRKKGVFVTLVSPDLVDTAIYRRNIFKGPEAALSFSGSRPLDVTDLERAFFYAMQTRPLEITLPRRRGWLVHLNNLFPNLMLWLYEPLVRRGLDHMEAARRKWADSQPGIDGRPDQRLSRKDHR